MADPVDIGPFQRIVNVGWPAGGWENINGLHAIPPVFATEALDPRFDGFNTSTGLHVVFGPENRDTNRVWTYSEAAGYVESIGAASSPLQPRPQTQTYIGGGKVLGGFSPLTGPPGATSILVPIKLAEATLGGSWSTVYEFTAGVSPFDITLLRRAFQQMRRIPGTSEAYVIVAWPGSSGTATWAGTKELYRWNGTTAVFEQNITWTNPLQESFVWDGDYHFRDFDRWWRATGSGQTDVTADWTLPDGRIVTYPTLADSKILTKHADTYSGVPGSWEKITTDATDAPFPGVIFYSGAGWDSDAKAWRQINRDIFSNPSLAGLWRLRPPAGKY